MPIVILGCDSSQMFDRISRCSKAMNTPAHAIIVNFGNGKLSLLIVAIGIFACPFLLFKDNLS